MPATTTDARTGTRAQRVDATTLLSGFLVVLVAVPSDLRVHGLDSAGSPIILLGLAAALGWVVHRLQRSTPLGAHRSAAAWCSRALVWLLLAVTLGSWVQAMLRPLPPFEASQANLGLLRMTAFAGLVLLTADGTTHRERLVTLLRRFVLAGSALALLGLAQFATGRSFVAGLTLPGLAPSQDFAAVAARGEFIRAAGTAMSPLEYSYVLVLVFPLALTFALFDVRRPLAVRALPAALVGAALLVSVSRSGLLGLAAVGAVLFVTWPARVRRAMVVVGLLALVALVVVVPGMVGTMRGLFTAGEADPSTSSRTGGLEVVHHFLPHVPVLGRGFGTFLPTYRIFDDAYLGLVVEIGFLGVGAFVGLLATTAWAAHAAGRRLLRRSGDDPDEVLLAQLGFALAAGVVAAAGLTALFDAFSFHMAVGALGLTLGLCGAFVRLTGAPR